MFKKLMNFRMRSGIAFVAVLVCLAWAGMNLSSSAEADLLDVDVALENAIAGSETRKCYQRMVKCNGNLTAHHCDQEHTGTNCSVYEIGCLFC